MKFLSINLLLVITLLISFNMSCEQVNSNDRNEVRMENEPTEKNIREGWEMEQEALRTKIEQTQERISNLLTTLENDLEKADDIAKSEINEKIKDLQQRKKLLEVDLKLLDTRVADNWDEYKANVDEHIEDAMNQIQEDI